MARRASSSFSPVLGLVAAALLIGLAIGGWFLFRSINDPFRTLSVLDVGGYLENANSLRGNSYKVEATISNQLAWSPTNGRLFTVEVAGGLQLLPILFPVQFNQQNIQKGQRYFIKIEVGDKGVLRAQELRKV